MNEDRRNTGGEGEPHVLEMDPHWSWRQLGLLGARHQVNRELLTLLKLVTKSNLKLIIIR